MVVEVYVEVVIGVAGDVEVVVEDEVVVTVVLGDEVVVVVTGKELNRGYQWMTSKLTFNQQLSHSWNSLDQTFHYRQTFSRLDFFYLFFNDVIIQMLVDGTNEYAGDVIAEKERGGKLTPKSRWVKWRPVITEEMKAVSAVIINMGVMHSPE